MKKFLAITATIICLMLTVTLVACNNNNGGENPPPSNYTRPSDASIDDTFAPTSKTLVAYFSKTNTTKGVAEKIQELTAADIFEIERKEPYPDAYTPTTEVAQDEKNANARPELSVYISDEAMAQYDTIILGFPIWWHTAPMPVLSFLNYYDMSGKTIYTFCTAASSGIAESTADIRNNADGATVIQGLKFRNGSDAAIETWLKNNDLTVKPEQPGEIVPPEQPEESVPPVYVADIPEITVDPQPITAPNGNVTESLTFEKNGNAYTVTGMSKNDTASAVVIPAEHDGLPVTTIGESAFAYSRHNADIQYVVIPDSVTVIERNAFYNRSEMVNVYISADSKLTTIGNNAFSGNGSLEFIYIPSGVSKIGDAAFNNCGTIDFAVSADNAVYRSDNGHLIETAKRTLIRGGQSGEVPNWITVISPSAFRRAVKVTSLTIPNSVTTIGNYFIADSEIVSIVYVGVEAQWNAIEKSASMWNYGNRDVELNFTE